MIKKQRGELIVEYALITTVVAALMLFLFRLAGTAVFKAYINKTAAVFLIRVGGWRDISGAFHRLANF